MEAINNYLDNVFDKLVTSTHKDYLSQQIPSELDAEISRLVNIFIQSTSMERELIHSKIREDHSFTLMGFAERMAALGVREQSQKRLLEGLLALVIEGGRFDLRENILVMAPLYHSAMKIRMDPNTLFEEAASYINNEVAKMLTLFPTRDPEDRSLEAMGYKESATSSGFIYEREW